MYPIILGSVLGMAIIIYKLYELLRIRIDIEKFVTRLFDSVKSGDHDKAIELCKINDRHPLARLCQAGIEKRSLTTHELEKLLERMGNREVKDLERYIGGLISIVGVEPLLGFLGTITGLIKAFRSWEVMGANVTVSSLAGGIYEAMITTAAGLSIAIPYYLICNFIISRVKYISYELSEYSMQLIEIMNNK